MLRLFIPQLIQEKKVLYLDIDIIVNIDLMRIYKINCNDTGIAMKNSIVYSELKNQQSANCGVMLMDLVKLRNNNFTQKCLDIHKNHNKMVTITAVKPPGRFGIVSKNSDGMVKEFSEKSDDEIGLINGGYFVLSPKSIDLIKDDDESWESDTLKKLVEIGEVVAYEHKGFWQPMDTLREKNILENLWINGRAPWKKWS
jgi:NDP-sugar pyrophosphorylase family protein